MMESRRIGWMSAIAALLALASLQAQAQALQPYVLAYAASGPLQAEVEGIKSKLAAAGFEIAGEYSPYQGAHVIGVTSQELKAAAAKESFGAFAAAQHVAVTESGGQLQVSYLNPDYLAAAYRLSSSLSAVGAALKTALGAQSTFGSEKGRTPEQLQEYNYMLGMEHFDDFYELGSHADHAQAVETVDASLAKGTGGVALVYRIEIPGRKQTLYGVSRAAVADQRANDGHIMADTVDHNVETKTTAYLPYQILVNDADVIAPHMRFRMAVWHPDLTMATFGKLMSSPGAIEQLLEQVAGGKKRSSGF